MLNGQQNTFEETLDSYINTLSSSLNGQNALPIRHASYHALVRMNGVYEPENGEKKRQDKLIDKSQRMGYDHVLGYDPHSPKISFCQFSTSNYSINDDEVPVEKLYINCNRDKVAEISRLFMKAAKKSHINITFKIAYEDGISDNYKRSDKIVIYTESAEQRDDIVGILQTLATKHKELFNSDYKRIPFMPKLANAPFISAPGPQKQGRYITFKGLGSVTGKPIINTWNSKMSEILQESLVFGVNMVHQGYYTPFNPQDPTARQVEECLSDCVAEYSKMREPQRAQVRVLMQSAILDLCQKNSMSLDSSLITSKEDFQQSLESKTIPPNEPLNTISNPPPTISKTLEEIN